jgi:hypothetical protein
MIVVAMVVVGMIVIMGMMIIMTVVVRAIIRMIVMTVIIMMVRVVIMVVIIVAPVVVNLLNVSLGNLVGDRRRRETERERRAGRYGDHHCGAGYGGAANAARNETRSHSFPPGCPGFTFAAGPDLNL